MSTRWLTFSPSLVTSSPSEPRAPRARSSAVSRRLPRSLRVRDAITPPGMAAAPATGSSVRCWNDIATPNGRPLGLSIPMRPVRDSL